MAAEDFEIPEQFNNTDDVLDIFADLRVRPHMQATVVPATYENDFFAPEKDNKTYNIVELGNDALLAQWESVHEDIRLSKVSPQTIHKIIEIAVNIKSVEENSRLLNWSSRPDSVTIGTGTLSTTRLMTTKMATSIAKQKVTDDDYTKAFQGEEDEDEDAGDKDDDNEKMPEDTTDLKVKAAGYLCLMLMRLMKKDPDYFMKGVTHCKRNFSQFYDQSSVTVLDFEIPRASVYAISDGLRSNAILNRTMVYHVTEGMKNLNRLSQSYHLLRFTFCQHVELMGLHAYKLFYELDSAFSSKLPTNVFLSWLTNDNTIKATKMISEIIEKYDNEKIQNEYLWLYARFLNNGFFYDLQTARCRYLVCILAYLSDSQIKKKNDNQAGALDLAELKKMSTADRLAAIDYAKTFEEEYTKLATTSTVMNRVQRSLQKKKGLAVSGHAMKRTRDETTYMETDEERNRRVAAEKRKHGGEGSTSNNEDTSSIWGNKETDTGNPKRPKPTFTTVDNTTNDDLPPPPPPPVITV